MSNKTVMRAREERFQASFEERSVWLQLAGLVLSLSGYLVVASRMLAAGVTALPAFAAALGVSVVLLVGVLIAGYVVVAVTSGPDGRDERDRLIEWRAESRSGWLLAAGVIVGLGCMVTGVQNVWTANLLLVSLYLAEILRLALQVIDYRRGF